ncbi:MAG: hypothetical protein ACXWNK_04305, partial [Vulcanimicrobiaceae bacterium]
PDDAAQTARIATGGALAARSRLQSGLVDRALYRRHRPCLLWPPRGSKRGRALDSTCRSDDDPLHERADDRRT